MMSASKKDITPLEQKFLRLFADKKIIILLTLLALLVLTIPYLLRPYKNLPISYEAYSILQKIPCPTFLPILMGAIFIIIFYFALYKSNKPLIASISSFFLILSPPFIYLFSTINSFAIPALLTLIALFLISKKYLNLSILFLIPMPFFGIINTIFSYSAVIIYILFNNKKYFYRLTPFLIFSIALFSFIYKTKFFNFFLFTFKQLPLKILFSDLDSNYGLGLFLTLLSLLGLSLLWQKKYKNLQIYLAIITFLLLSMLIEPAIFYLNIILIPLSTLGILRLYNRKWYSKTIRNFTILAILLGIIFSTISYTNRLSQFPPTQELVDSIKELDNIAEPNSIIFSHESRGPLISYFTKTTPLLQPSFKPNSLKKQRDSEILFQTRKLETALDIIKTHNIQYILIDKEMKQGLVWQEEEQGLLFLIKYSKVFKKKYSNEVIEIWSIDAND